MSLAVPVVTYPPELPVSRMRDEIAATIAADPVVIVAGETGSGKTTQLPKICLELGRRTIAHTQPRRIAARTIAERVAEELVLSWIDDDRGLTREQLIELLASALPALVTVVPA